LVATSLRTAFIIASLTSGLDTNSSASLFALVFLEELDDFLSGY
jgi:hypothetical protein